MGRIELQYRFFSRWQNVVVACFVAVILYQGFYYLHPTNQDWRQSAGFSWLNVVRFILLDQVLIECITISILFLAIRLYAKFLKLNTIQPGAVSHLPYFLSFLPLFLTVYFLFAPVTLSARFLYHYLTYPDLAIRYKDYYFLNQSIYVAYLIPVLVIGYGTLCINLLIEKAWKAKEFLGKPILPNEKMLLVKDNIGELPVQVSDIACIKKEGRSITVKTPAYSYFTYNTLDMLEKELEPYGFVRINRSTLLPLRNIKNYSFWENEKYIIRTKDGEEYIMSRERLKKIRSKIVEGG